VNTSENYLYTMT